MAIIFICAPLWLMTGDIDAASPLTLDASQVAALAAAHAPAVTLAALRVDEAESLRIGADALAPTNPEIDIMVGPGFVSRNQIDTEYMITLKWPVDFSGARGLRMDTAIAEREVARQNLADQTRRSVGAALDAYIRAQGAASRVTLAQERAALDDDVVRIAQVRYAAGTIGAGDVALARVLQAQSAAQLRYAEGDAHTILSELRWLIAIDPQTPLKLTPPPPPDTDAASLSDLLARVHERTDVLRAQASRILADADATLQDRLAVPVPRLAVGGGRGPEYQFEMTLEMPLPIYQRNQTNVAVARARQHTAVANAQVVESEAAAQVRASWAVRDAALQAYAHLDAAMAAIADAEHLAMRGFELGQASLATLVATRREAVAARSARLDAQIAAWRADLALRLAAGLV